ATTNTCKSGENLKPDPPRLPVDNAALEAFRTSAGTRPIFLASSTHPGEEELILDASREVERSHPGLLRGIVPRHPERGAEIEALTIGRGFSAARRSKNALPASTTQVYV